MPEGTAGGSPWAADGPAGAWWRGDPAAAAARFAALDRPAAPSVPIVTIPVPPDPAPLAGAGEMDGGSATAPRIEAPAPHAEPVASLVQPPEADAVGQPPEADALAKPPETDALGQPPETDALGQPAEAAAEAEALEPVPAEADASREPETTALGPAAAGAADAVDSAAWVTSPLAQPGGEPAEAAESPASATGEPLEAASEEIEAVAAGTSEPSGEPRGHGEAHAFDEPSPDVAEAGSDGATAEDGAGPDAFDASALEDPASLTDAELGESQPTGAVAEDGALVEDASADGATTDHATEDDTFQDSTYDETPPEETALVEAVAADVLDTEDENPPAETETEAAPEAAVPVQPAARRMNRSERHASIARDQDAVHAAAVTEVAGAEPDTHTRETVVLPPMPDRALIPTPSPAPDDDELPFWLPMQDVPRRDRYSNRRPGRLPKPPRSPAVGLVGLVVLALLATFFAWVSAEPLWLAVGHGDTGTATVSECTGSGVGQRCVGEFSAASGAFTAEGIRLVGVSNDQSAVGSTVTARMVGADSGRAYVGDGTAVRHLRWALGLILVVLCGLGLVWVTGARRLEDRWSRRTATLTALTAPLLVTVAFLASTF